MLWTSLRCRLAGELPLALDNVQPTSVDSTIDPKLIETRMTSQIIHSVQVTEIPRSPTQTPDLPEYLALLRPRQSFRQ